MWSVEIESWLASIIDATSSVREVWLFGSRANKTSTEASDWDFMMYLEEGAIDDVAKLSHFHRADVDLLVSGYQRRRAGDSAVASTPCWVNSAGKAT